MFSPCRPSASEEQEIVVAAKHTDRIPNVNAIHPDASKHHHMHYLPSAYSLRPLFRNVLVEIQSVELRRVHHDPGGPLSFFSAGEAEPTSAMVRVEVVDDDGGLVFWGFTHERKLVKSEEHDNLRIVNWNELLHVDIPVAPAAAMKDFAIDLVILLQPGDVVAAVSSVPLHSVLNWPSVGHAQAYEADPDEEGEGSFREFRLAPAVLHAGFSWCAPQAGKLFMDPDDPHRHERLPTQTLIKHAFEGHNQDLDDLNAAYNHGKFANAPNHDWARDESKEVPGLSIERFVAEHDPARGPLPPPSPATQRGDEHKPPRTHKPLSEQFAAPGMMKPKKSDARKGSKANCCEYTNMKLNWF